MSLLLQQAFQGVLLPVLVAAAVLLAGLRPWRRPGAEGRGGWWGAWALAAAFFAASWALRGRPHLPAREATEWIPWLAVPAAAAALPLARRLPGWGTWLARGALSLALSVLLLLPLLRHTWSAGAGTAWIAGLAAAVLLLWWALEGLAARLRDPSVPLVLLGVASGSGAVLMLSGSALLGQLAGALAAALGPLWLVSWWRKDAGLGRAAVPVVVVVLAGLWMAGRFYADLPAASAALLALAGPAAWTVLLPPVRRLALWARLAIGAAAVIVPLAAALVLTLRASPPGPYY
jgi:hypothetical protein